MGAQMELYFTTASAKYGSSNGVYISLSLIKKYVLKWSIHFMMVQNILVQTEYSFLDGAKYIISNGVYIS
jgi:hypothetical protein